MNVSSILSISVGGNGFTLPLTSAIFAYRSFSQKDPRIEFKREAARLYDEMISVVEDKTTDVIMRGKMSYQGQGKNPPGQRVNPAEDADGAQQAAPAVGGGTEGQSAQNATKAPPANQAGLPRVVRPAAQVQSKKAKKKPASSGQTAVQAIGRNEMVTLLNPESGEREEMKFKKAKPLIEQGWRLAED